MIREDFENAFQSVDMIIGPTTPTPAFRFGEKVNNPLSMYLADVFTVAVNLAGLPALSLPAGSIARDHAALPIGLQLIARANAEPQLFAAAKEIEALF